MDERRVGAGGQRNFGLGQSGAANLSQGPGHEGQGRFEDIVNQTTGTVRDVADQASAYAEEAYERGRQVWNRYPEVDRYFREGRRVVGQRVGEHPIFAILLAGSIGYLFGYLIHGLHGSETIPDYARKRAYDYRPGYR